VQAGCRSLSGRSTWQMAARRLAATWGWAPRRHRLPSLTLHRTPASRPASQSCRSRPLRRAADQGEGRKFMRVLHRLPTRFTLRWKPPPEAFPGAWNGDMACQALSRWEIRRHYHIIPATSGSLDDLENTISPESQCQHSEDIRW
jgi:hypothetical protein